MRTGTRRNRPRGETLPVCVAIVLRNSRSYRRPKFRVRLGVDLVLVLRVEAGIGIGLVNLRYAERLSKAGAVVSAAQEVSQRGEGITAADGARKRDGVVVVQEVGAHADGVSALLRRQAVGTLVELVDARRWAIRTGFRTTPRPKC